MLENKVLERAIKKMLQTKVLFQSHKSVVVGLWQEEYKRKHFEKMMESVKHLSLDP